MYLDIMINVAPSHNQKASLEAFGLVKDARESDVHIKEHAFQDHQNYFTDGLTTVVAGVKLLSKTSVTTKISSGKTLYQLKTLRIILYVHQP